MDVTSVGSVALSWGQMFLSGIYYLVMTLIIFALVGLVWWVIYWLNQYKYRVRIRRLIGTKRVISDDKARAVKKDGVIYWQLFKRPKVLLPVPPSEALDITTKGKICLEVYQTGEDEFSYLKDTGVVKQFQSLKTNQRLVLVKQYERAATKKKTKWTDYIMPVAGGAMVLIIFVMCFAFWEDVTKPLLAAHEQSVKIAEQNAKITTTLHQIIQQKQILKDDNDIRQGVPE